MVWLVAQVSDVHIGAEGEDNGARLTGVVDAINAMTVPPDLVLLTGDLTEHGRQEEWAELRRRLEVLGPPWVAIRGNHDGGLSELAGHRSMRLGPMRLVLLDTSAEEIAADDLAWLDAELDAHSEQRTVIAMHHPPFETGIWWLDCMGLAGAAGLEALVRRHPQVVQVVAGHAHRPIQSAWGSCALWVAPSTAPAVAPDLDPAHHPAATAEPSYVSLHAYLDEAVVSHLVPTGPAAVREPADAPDVIAWARTVQQARTSKFAGVERNARDVAPSLRADL